MARPHPRPAPGRPRQERGTASRLSTPLRFPLRLLPPSHPEGVLRKGPSAGMHTLRVQCREEPSAGMLRNARPLAALSEGGGVSPPVKQGSGTAEDSGNPVFL
jgi:hypothetical protein